MNRRQALTPIGVAFASAFAGCLGNISGTASENEDDDDNSANSGHDGEMEDNPSGCSFNVEIVEDPPDDASLVIAEDENLREIEIIDRILEEATDSEKQHGTVTRGSGEYEQFSVIPESTEEFESAETTLESLPRYDDPDYPSGVYVKSEDDEIVVAIVDQCRAPEQGDEEDGERTDDVNDPEALIESYEDKADPLAFETLQLGSCGSRTILPGGICSDDPDPLKRVAETDYFEPADPYVYGFVLGSAKDAEQINEDVLNDIGIAGGSLADTYDRPSTIIEDTDFETDYLLLIQSFFPSTPAELAVGFAGDLTDNETFVGISMTAGVLEEITHLTTLIRAKQNTPPETIIIGQIFDREASEGEDYAVYTNESR